MNTCHVPDALIDELRQYSAAAETAGQLLPQQLDVIYQQRWFKLFVPQQYGGLQLSLPQGVQLEEELARIDGSLGWTVTLCAGATLFVGYLHPEVATGIFRDDAVCFGGSGRPNGLAKEVEDGYVISGRWRWATGAPHCTIFTANCLVEQGGKLLQKEDGSPLIQAFFFTKNEVTIYADWNTMGLKATAGHSFGVTDLHIPANRRFTIDSAHATINHPIYHYPFLPFAEATLAANTSGMALHFLELCSQVFDAKSSTASSAGYNLFLQQQLGDAQQQLDSLRQNFYAALETSWQLPNGYSETAKTTLADVSRTSRQLAKGARQLVEALYPHCGMLAADPSSTINRVWRDLHTASQHSLLNYPVM